MEQAARFVDPVPMFSNEWRAEKIRLGDLNMARAHELIENYNKSLPPSGEMRTHELNAVNSRATVLIMAAQAYYMAANVRGRG